jgi:superfamily II DNA or RNA helicase
MLRKHQASFDAVVRGICNGTDNTHTVYVYACPGGGKSLLPVIAGKLISAGIVDKVAWFVPRLTLQYQGENDFLDPYFRKLLHHNLTIRSSTSDTDPSRGLNGFATTYQAIGMNNGEVIKDFKRYRYALILDEFHHLEEGGEWHKAVEPIYRLAKFKLLMTGTLYRGDDKPIAYLKYENGKPAIPNEDGFRYIRYSRTDALRERATIPVKFYLHDGSARWKNKDGDEYEYDQISKAPEKDASAALYTAIRTQFADQMLERGIRHWLEHKKSFRSSKAIVVAANIELAEMAQKRLKQWNFDCALATSSDPDSAKETIRLFKGSMLDIMAGVAMFYEGFSVKQISHIICLTNYRSWPWIEQMVARAVRIDPAIAYDEQFAHVFAPDDPLFRRIVNAIKTEQMPFIKMRDEKKVDKQMSLFDDGDGGEGKVHPVTPLSSGVNGFRETVLGTHGAPIQEGLTVFQELAPSEQERLLRKDIEEHVRRYAREAGYKPFQINRDLKDMFGKARGDMTLYELRKLKEHLQIYYRIDRCRRPAVRRSATAL